MSRPFALCLVAFLAATAGCASRPADESAGAAGRAAESAERSAENDPLEPVNRQIFAANLALDTFILRPAAVAYRDILPEFAKERIRNILNNLEEPFTIVNDIAQGELGRAQTAYGRFLMNSTLGLAGMFDLAQDYGLARHEEDAGQTFAVWGMPDGPYLVLPVLGPSNLRDSLGRAIEYFADPVKLVAVEAGADDYMLGRGIASGVDTRARNIESIDALRSQSLDLYSATRSVYRQRRAAQIENKDGGAAER